MKSSGGTASKEDASAGGQGQPTGRPPHWRRRDPAATAVYVVHPTQFRTIVQQLTGAASSPPAVSTAHAHHQGGGGGGNDTGVAAAGGTNAVAQPQQQHGCRGEDRSGGGSGRTLGQMYQECMAWADADDY